MSVKVRVLAMMALCMAMVAHADGWKYKWPVLCPDVLEQTHEATTCVPLDANLTVSVACADGAQESAWAAATGAAIRNRQRRRERARIFFSISVYPPYESGAR